MDDEKRFAAIEPDATRWDVIPISSNLGSGEPISDGVQLLFDREDTAGPYPFSLFLAPAAARGFAHEIIRLADRMDERRRRTAESN